MAAEGMKTLLGFLCVTAVELLRLTYLERTSPQRPAQDVVTSLQIRLVQKITAHSASGFEHGYSDSRLNDRMGVDGSFC